MKDRRIGFIQYIIGAEEEGYVVLATRNLEAATFWEFFFKYPDELDSIQDYLIDNEHQGDIYFCPTILTKERRVKANIVTSNVLWGDLDTCPPNKLLVKPTVVVQTSPKNYQAYWKLKQTAHALDVERINSNIGYRHEDDGYDINGWALTKYLRVPNTRNFKYPEAPLVEIIEFNKDNLYDLEDFNVYPKTNRNSLDNYEEYPDELPNFTGAELLDKYSDSVHQGVWKLFIDIPDDDWSTKLWNLHLTLFELGLPKEEILIISRDAACNKYKRDGRPEIFLWKEILRAEQAFKNKTFLISEVETDTNVSWNLADKEILSDEELGEAVRYKTFIDDYISWGREISDASSHYHIAGAFVILSGILSDKLRLPTAYGNIVPNLWFMIVADTTLTRKSTAMDMAMDFLYEENRNILLATDGSIEGLLQALSVRKNEVSLFLRDEFTGLIDQMSKKDYMSGMMETLTKLYDAKPLRRLLKKEVIDIQDPLLLIFAGGIRTKLLEQITYDHINSGFMPRFCFVQGKSESENIRPLGPPTIQSIGRKKELTEFVEKLNLIYNPDSKIGKLPINQYKPEANYHEVSLSDDAWRIYNRIEKDMTDIGLNSSLNDLMTPMMTRLAQSGLKMAMLIAAADTMDVPVVVQKIHILKAFYFVRVFKDAAIEVVANADKTAQERLFERIYKEVLKYDEGVSRAAIMSRFRINARDARNVFDTLVQRGSLKEERRGGSTFYKAVKYRDNKRVAL